MRRFQFSIAALAGAIAFVAIGACGLRASNDFWDGATLLLALLVLLGSVLLCVHSVPRGRAYWLGFSLFGWAYLAASLIPQIEPRLPTTRGLALLDSGQPAQNGGGLAFFDFDNDGDMDILLAEDATGGGVGFLTGPGKATIGNFRPAPQGWLARWWPPSAKRGGTTESFVRIGHSLVALVLAFLGGRLSLFLHDRGQRTVMQTTEPQL